MNPGLNSMHVSSIHSTAAAATTADVNADPLVLSVQRCLESPRPRVEERSTATDEQYQHTDHPHQSPPDSHTEYLHRK